jgi:CubicO group peptidase (beta-lactamase class C family)
MIPDKASGLDDRVERHPEFGAVKVWTSAGPVEPNRAITVRDLLRHTSGLTYGFFGNTRRFALPRPPVGRAKDLADLMPPHGAAADRAAGHPVQLRLQRRRRVPGHRVASGCPRSFLATRIFRPLKMPDTFFEVPADKRSRFTGYYAKQGDRWLLADSPDSGTYTKPVKLLSGGGGLISSTPDYLRFMQMVLNEGELDGVRILKRKTVAAMLRNQLPGEAVPISVSANDSIRVLGFGLGFAVVVDIENRSLGPVAPRGGVLRQHVLLRRLRPRTYRP